MWEKRSELIVPLTSLTFTESKWDWTDKHKKAFNTIKNVISCKTLLSYLDFTKPFDIHTDASDLHLGTVISQNKNPIVFYSRKFNPAERRYTMTEKELLAIVETLK